MNTFHLDEKIDDDFQFVIVSLLKATQNLKVIWNCNSYYLWFIDSDSVLGPAQIMNTMEFCTICNNVKVKIYINSFLYGTTMDSENNFSDISVHIAPKQHGTKQITEHNVIVTNTLNRNSELELLLSFVMNYSFVNTKIDEIKNNIKDFYKNITHQHITRKSDKEIIEYSQQVINNKQWSDFYLRSVSNDLSKIKY